MKLYETGIFSPQKADYSTQIRCGKEYSDLEFYTLLDQLSFRKTA